MDDHSFRLGDRGRYQGLRNDVMLRVVLLMLWCLLYSGSLGAQEDLAFPTKLNFREFANSKVQQKIYLAAHQENIERLKAHLESVKKKWAENKLDDAMEKFRRGNIEKMRNQIAILEKTGPPVLPPRDESCKCETKPDWRVGVCARKGSRFHRARSQNDNLETDQ